MNLTFGFYEYRRAPFLPSLNLLRIIAITLLTSVIQFKIVTVHTFGHKYLMINF